MAKKMKGAPGGLKGGVAVAPKAKKNGPIAVGVKGKPKKTK